MADILLSVGMQTGSAETSEFINQLQGAINALNKSNNLNAKIGVKLNEGNLNELQNKIAETLNRLSNSGASSVKLKLDGVGEFQVGLRKAAKAADDTTDAFKRLKQLQTEIGQKQIKAAGLDPQKNAEQIKVLNGQIASLKAEYDKLFATVGGNLDQGKVTELQQGMDKITRSASEATARLKDQYNGMNALNDRFVYMLSLANIAMQGVRQLKQMVNTTVELDTAMTQLRIVTNASEADYSNYSKTVAKTAQDIGASITDLIDSTTVFARLGYSLDDSGALAKYTAMLSNVGAIDVSSAQSALTAITKAYGISADEIESIMDKMVAVGNNFPISVAEIAEGMNNAGSALSAAGNSFEQSVALLTAANTTIQNISKSSTGLRTITARIRKTKLELDELGEAIETAQYQKALDILTEHKVALTDNGEFRATYDILQDIASIWHELTSMEQANIAEQLAGKILLLLPVCSESCA